MRARDYFEETWEALDANRGRSLLTILGIVIGIAAVISLVGLGKGLQSNVQNSISSLGTTDITIQSQDPERQTSQREPGGGMPGGGGGMRGGFSFGGGNTASITVDEYTFIKNHDDITLASPSESTRVAVT